ncbi:MAG: hypothetical protein GX040_11295 [Alcaligenaceae bacterium]|nr:hypothetical protein [Alcaligenaceae bacterium]
MAKTDYRKGDLAGLGMFVAIPYEVMDSSGYQNLSTTAIKLLLDICRQLSGKNNGKLSPTWELMKHRGWKSKATLQKAKDELRASRLITITRAGTTDKGNCEFWAVNWLKLDWDKCMDIEPAGHDYKGYLNLKDVKIDPIPERRKPPVFKIVA